MYLVRHDFKGTRQALITRWIGKGVRDWVAEREDAEVFTEADAIKAIKRWGGSMEPITVGEVTS